LNKRKREEKGRGSISPVRTLKDDRESQFERRLCSFSEKRDLENWMHNRKHLHREEE